MDGNGKRPVEKDFERPWDPTRVTIKDRQTIRRFFLKHLLNQIDKAIGALYNLDLSLEASSYLTARKELKHPGALLIKEPQSNPSEIQVGIAFQDHISQELEKMHHAQFQDWNLTQLRAFSVAAEEVSHFRYLVHHSALSRPISHLELEFHGELDRFLVFYLFHSVFYDHTALCFENSFGQLFEQFSLVENLTVQEKERYLEASQIAREFILKHRDSFSSQDGFSKLLGELRALYRMSPQDKFSLIHRL